MTETYDRYSFVARFGEALMRGGVATIPAALFRYQGELGLTVQQTWFIAAILAHKWDDRMPYPSLSKMAEQCGSSRRQLHNYERQLIEDGWLHVTHRYTEEGGQTSNFFDFSPLFTRLVALLDRDKPVQEGVKAGSQRGENSPSQAGGNPNSQAPVNHSAHKEEARKEEKKKRKNGGAPSVAPALSPSLDLNRVPLEQQRALRTSGTYGKMVQY